MSASQCAATAFPLLGSASRTPSNMSRRESGGIFSSLKHTLSRKHTANSNTQQNSHPQAKYMAQPTRRPAAPSTNPFDNPASFDAPPAYSAAPEVAAPNVVPNTSSTPVTDDAYAFLDTFDTIFLIDDSGSMAGGLWRQTADALMTITPICTAHDADGVDIHFLNHKTIHENVTSAGKVQEIFESVRPGGATPIGKKLTSMFRTYFEKYQAKPQSTKPINIICITDGVPTDDVESPLIFAAKKLDKLEAPAWQIGVQFFQVGTDPDATKYLKELDDELAELAHDSDMRDIVDTVPFKGMTGTTLSANGILKVVLGAVMRRLDRKSRELHR